MTMQASGTDGFTFPDNTTQKTAFAPGMRNKIINGAMMIDQRNAGASVTPAADAYLLDRWQFNQTQASKFSFQQNAGSVTPPAGFKNYLGATVVSAYSVATGDIFNIRQSIEGFNIADLSWGTANAKSVTLSFWVYSSLTGTFGGVVANGATTYCYPFTYSIPAANTWTYISITIAGPTSGTFSTDNTAGAQVRFGLGVGSTYSATAGSWQSGTYASATGATSVVGTNGATFYITGVQLEKGATATPFENRLYGTELALCQRYYQKSFEPAVVPANGVSGLASIAGAYNSTDFFCANMYSFRSQMRAVPTIVLFGAVNAVGTWDIFAGGWFTFNTATVSSFTSGFAVTGTRSGLTGGSSYPIAGNFTASAEL